MDTTEMRLVASAIILLGVGTAGLSLPTFIDGLTGSVLTAVRAVSIVLLFLGVALLGYQTAVTS